MPLNIIRADITTLKVDAIVNPCNRNLLLDGGLAYSLKQKAGAQLEQACKSLAPCEPGQIKVSEGYKLPCKFIFHTVGPKWQGGQQAEQKTLALCYRNALVKAQELKLNSIAFPLIATGNYGFPKDLALSVATSEISNFILQHDLLVYLVVFDKNSYQISKERFKEVESYIDDNYVSSKDNRIRRVCDVELLYSASKIPQAEEAPKTLDELLKHLDESFSDMLLRKIKERGMTAVECYKKANIDKKLFSKIQSNRFYKPKKATVLAFAIALELPLEEMSEMLQKAGFALSRSNKADIIIQYYVQKHNYNIFEINETLFAFDQQLIGI